MALGPALHGLRDMRGHALAQAPGQPLRAFQQVLVQCLAQGGVGLQAAAQRGQAALQVADQCGVVALQVGTQAGMDARPQPLHVLLQGRVVDHFLLELPAASARSPGAADAPARPAPVAVLPAPRAPGARPGCRRSRRSA
ncbi:hypothetical protein G6F22_018405 [Rhizopus arrhizus]|nr:hypothetical protein G6F22_018405 [Rhizopus arrhizus]